MPKYLSQFFSVCSAVVLLALVYPGESAIGNLMFSAPIDVMLLCFALGAALAIFSKVTLEAKVAQCFICLLPAVVLLARIPTPL